jgi:hypothetical protein
VLALLPGHIAYTPVLMSEVLFTCLIVLAFWLAPRAPPVVPALLAGVTLAAATLVRAQAALLLPALIAGWVIAARSSPRVDRRLVTAVVALAVAFLVAMAPWTVRNAIRLDTFEPVSTNLGMNLWIGNNPEADGGYLGPPLEELTERVDHLPLPAREVAFNREARNEALEYAVEHPLTTLSRLPRKLFETYRYDRSATAWYEPPGADYLDNDLRTAIDRACDAAWYLLLMLALAGGAVMWRMHRGALALPASVIAVWTLVALIFFGEPRFHYPLLPVPGYPGGGCARRAWALPAGGAGRGARLKPGGLGAALQPRQHGAGIGRRRPEDDAVDAAELAQRVDGLRPRGRAENGHGDLASTGFAC